MRDPLTAKSVISFEFITPTKSMTNYDETVDLTEHIQCQLISASSSKSKSIYVGQQRSNSL